MIAVNLRVYDREMPFGWRVHVDRNLVRFWNVRMDPDCAAVLAATAGEGTAAEHLAALTAELHARYAGDWLFDAREAA